MSDRNQECLEDRKFLHDLATPLTILKLRLKKLQSTFTSDDASKSMVEDMFKQMYGAIEKIERLHAEQKEKIHKRQDDLNG